MEIIKRTSETERAKKKSYTSDLKATKWKIAQILDSIREEAEAGNEVTGTITLDDVDVEGRKLDIELVKGEMKEAQEDDEFLSDIVTSLPDGTTQTIWGE